MFVSDLFADMDKFMDSGGQVLWAIAMIRHLHDGTQESDLKDWLTVQMKSIDGERGQTSLRPSRNMELRPLPVAANCLNKPTLRGKKTGQMPRFLFNNFL